MPRARTGVLRISNELQRRAEATSTTMAFALGRSLTATAGPSEVSLRRVIAPFEGPGPRSILIELERSPR